MSDKDNLDYFSSQHYIHSTTTTAVNTPSEIPTYNKLEDTSADPPVIPDLTLATTSGSVEFERLTIRLVCSCFVYFLCGWGDGGTVLPYFELDFHLTTMTSSLCYATQTVGFALGTILVERVMKLFGQFWLLDEERSYLPAIPALRRLIPNRFLSPRKSSGVGYSEAKSRLITLLVSSMIHPCFFIILGLSRRFSDLLIAYALVGFARSLMTGKNAYVASTPSKGLGIILGFWSSGSFLAPLVCQTIMATGVPWRHFYLGSLVLSGINIAFLIWAFRPTVNEFEADKKAAIDTIKSALASETTVAGTASEGKEDASKSESFHAPQPANTLALACRMPYQWAFSVFSGLYNGSETTMSAFIVTFLLGARAANPSTVGYAGSGFWGGMAVSRFLWGYFTPKLTYTQRKHIIHGCTSVAFLMSLLILLIHSDTENSFGAAIVGLVYGPIYPASLGLSTEVLPREVHMVAMAINSAMASFASALMPFIAGVILTDFGVKNLIYMTMAQGAAMTVLWALFPSSPPSRVSSSSNA
ncbi:MFS general substrate transporter [Coniophora puteana RWD-64-598 SS2]|uniref:MFS general substrate transporter n=1 Tax=Coniophora puteana (strain RWD-64-598) TaxID=741705 RepID=A0A5M3N539_CONPW|nr:MFS general substrate transporter [Coniophora puteana RWD-64-598 SS2]EIW86532.1 MFS general substrate transporter [Coniophora puteana RWD-64-598 SS2]